jgi:hypothetical protein
MARVRVETFLAAIFAILAIATFIWPTWIEALTGLEPDAGSGALEWLIVAVFGLLAIGASLLARRDYRAVIARRSGERASDGA